MTRRGAMQLPSTRSALARVALDIELSGLADRLMARVSTLSS